MTFIVSSLERDGGIPVLVTEEHSISFILSVLVEDGLQVPPFTHHAERVGRWQTLGLSAPIWAGWLSDTVREFEHFRDFLSELASVRRSREAPASAASPVRWLLAKGRGRVVNREEDRKLLAARGGLQDPLSYLVGLPTLRKELRPEWKAFRKRRRSRSRSELEVAADEADEVIEHLGGGRPWRVLFVPYPGAVVTRVGEATILWGQAVRQDRAWMLRTLSEMTAEPA